MFDRIVLIGAGRTSGSIVERLARMAPLTILDVSAEALAHVTAPASATSEGVQEVVMRAGDGTSRLVLEDVRGDARSSAGLVIATGDDRAAIESCRLGAELGYRPIVAIVNDRGAATECEKHGARTLVRAELVGQVVAQCLQQEGLGITSAVGSGRGEILEFSALPSSPLVGVPLANLGADGWRIAAIYRGTDFVLPTGATTVEPHDRVLIAGDPKQLPHVAESLRVGLPTFPLLQGPNVVVYLPTGLDRVVEEEAEVLTKRTRAARLVRVYPGASSARSMIEASGTDGRTTLKPLEDAPLDGRNVEEHVETLRAKQPGVVVTLPAARRPLDVLLGRGGRDAILCNGLGVPVLFRGGATRHDRVVLCVTDGYTDLGVGEVALDLARTFDVPLLVLRVKLPTYLQAADVATDKLMSAIAHRARLHGLKPDVQVVQGNPITEWVRMSTPADVAVISRRASMRDSFSSPDIALRVARESRGSVLVLTVSD